MVTVIWKKIQGLSFYIYCPYICIQYALSCVKVFTLRGKRIKKYTMVSGISIYIIFHQLSKLYFTFVDQDVAYSISQLLIH